jgi:hypothetical protein
MAATTTQTGSPQGWSSGNGAFIGSMSLSLRLQASETGGRALGVSLTTTGRGEARPPTPLLCVVDRLLRVADERGLSRLAKIATVAV